MTASRRRAFTLVELLIVIAIIGILMGLLLPAIQAARGRARMATCNNNMSQLAKAMQNYALKGKGVFPGWANEVKLNTGTIPADTLVVTWAGKILAELDEQTLRDQMLSGADFQMFTKPPRLDIFICPSDAGTDESVGRLSYIVNSGIPDPITPAVLSGTAVSDLKFNGICHDLRPGRKGPVIRFGGKDILDGVDSTLLISENIQKDDGTTWMGPLQDNPVNGQPEMIWNPEQRFGMVWPALPVPNPQIPPIPDPLTEFQPFNRDIRDPSDGVFTQGMGSLFARPASAHPEVFVVAFCGGNTRELSQDIEFRVYQQLMTPNGRKATVPNVTPPRDYTGYMFPPLGDGQY